MKNSGSTTVNRGRGSKFFAALLSHVTGRSSDLTTGGPPQTHEKEKQQKGRRLYSSGFYSSSTRVDESLTTNSEKETVGHGKHKPISKASISSPVPQSPISLTGLDNDFDSPSSPGVGVRDGLNKPSSTTYENAKPLFQHPHYDWDSSISLQSSKSAVTRAASRMYHLPSRLSYSSLLDDYEERSDTFPYQNQGFQRSCTTLSTYDSRPKTPEDDPDYGLSPTEPPEFGEIGMAIGDEEGLDSGAAIDDYYYLPQRPEVPRKLHRDCRDSETTPSPVSQLQHITWDTISCQANPPLLFLLRLLRKKASAPISAVVNKATIALMCEILDQGQRVDIASELNSADDVEILLDFTFYLIDNGYLRNVSVQGANRKARRLMCKLLAKTPVIPKSIFMTGVNARMCSLASRIGIGGFGCVFEGEYQGTRVALKVLYKVRRDDDFCREALVWRSLSHPYIMPLLGIYEEQSLYFLVSPYMENGTLADWRNNQNPSTTDIERRIREVAEGVRYIHSEGIVHGDLRGANVLLDDNFHCQIADFGLARHSDITVTRSTTALSFSFSAPELFGACSICNQSDEDGECPGCGDNGTQRPMKTPETDVYGFGCLYYEIHFDHIPFKGFGEAQIIRSVTTGKRPPRLQEPRLTDTAWNLIQRCWAMDAKNRPTMTDIVNAINAKFKPRKEFDSAL